MNIKEYRLLKVMEEIDNDNHVSQRNLSEKLEMSLGLVNSFVKHLTSKGYFKAKSLPKRRVRYILTPEGAAEKTKLVYDYVRHSFDLYKSSYARIHDMVKSLVENGTSSVIVYGVSNITDIALQELEYAGVQVKGVLDDFNEETVFKGHPIVIFDCIQKIPFDKVIVTACDNEKYSIDKLIKSGINPHDIVTI